MYDKYKDTEKRREYMKEWQRAHLEEHREANRRWRESHPDHDKSEEYKVKNRERARQFRETHPGMVKTPKQMEHWRGYQQGRIAERTAYVNEYKVAHGCQVCGYNANPVAMDFHHTGEKVKIVAVLKHGTMEKLMAEISKCEVLCANCHRILHHPVIDAPIPEVV
jgi:hypothetical protein